MTKRAPKPENKNRSEENLRSLMLINDDVNSFDHVIRSLVDVCGHDEIQAEQCAVLTHIKGGCVIKIADVRTVEKMRMKLRELSLDTVVI
ncbi:MAG TPA: ATP-dependent Clp protease adaptor ClpS [Bacteroidales bacterium]|jgi:ATP-dependent Clp protease adaptor protein ClpS|nr:ATP-dependent Clp protease adaptor ClpS [Bacteroidales bacterium]MDI9532467.1 ATP-dependent Clp protease adaptor ClpS [Bacteroidota bacterium]MBP7036199.1 ATP-dependent Clp protease adaptor ClpS [Bacteroidales bacterium]MBP8710052.1 ATP-dependent Clp protease adaptor ClpS [Bacteroidales bacterium]MZQ79845.1 ATP-dependent Clp protease adaptor ClpS [Bacteroidales bacterium]